jgi:hypothetical protein
MLDEHYPTVDLEFIKELILSSDKIEGTLQVGTTTAYIVKGIKPISKRTILLRETDGQVGFMHATGYAITLGLMPKLLKWFEKNRDWKNGAYIIKKAH